jgi:hypothetical protein
MKKCGKNDLAKFNPNPAICPAMPTRPIPTPKGPRQAGTYVSLGGGHVGNNGPQGDGRVRCAGAQLVVAVGIETPLNQRRKDVLEQHTLQVLQRMSANEARATCPLHQPAQLKNAAGECVGPGSRKRP